MPLPPRRPPLLATPLPALDDPEGPRVPAGLPAVVDAHVHLFPDPLWDAIDAWFRRHAWPNRYRLNNAGVTEFLLSRGIDRIVALQYAHRPGWARSMNRELAATCAAHPRVTGLATVFPGEPDARAILEEAFALGLAGVKLHLHVQAVAVDDPVMDEIYRCCADHGRPLVMHAGREPKSPAYPRDVYELCGAARIEPVLSRFPSLKLCIPHLGADEYDAHRRMLETHDNLWLDTAMVLADYFPYPVPWGLLAVRPERVMYGTDFPNIPYAWDRELQCILARKLDRPALERILGGTARELFGLD
ncbi:MAG: amidohydrolase [Deltaproteobacteria bacterium]|nr:amidohydrolase [Deltaproteobacteria bacterium]